MKISKLKLLSKKPKEFSKWAIGHEKKIPKQFKEDFSSVWPKVQNTNEQVRGAFVVHWSLIVGSTFNTISFPIVIGTMTYMQLAAESVNRLDLSEVLQKMMQNFSRINAEISSHQGDTDEEE
tara:strand:- start:639 stop:1004 length:366 start_codon:yes stop_codon:yes gene_type:complete